MVFNWNDFKEENFNVACEELKGSDFNEVFIGAVRVGDLCFDILTREYNEKLYLDYDLYVGGVDTGYGYADDYPYDYCSGGSFAVACADMSYEEFKAYAENIMKECIEKENAIYEHTSLIDKANEELNIW